MYSIIIIQIIFILLNILNNNNVINCDNEIENDLNTSLVDDLIDPNGYVVYCPCMGRFGNQADHFLGSLGFAHALNRTLILPAWVEYRKGDIRSQQIPFDKYFQIEPLHKYHRVITMEKFMKELAPTIWPPQKRVAFCYTARPSLTQNTVSDCNAKEGNPFGPFWDNYNVDFIGSEYYQPLSYDVHYGRNVIKTWSEKYPSDKWPVLAFVGAPAVFPVQKENVHLQKYVQWSDDLNKMAKHFIKQYLPKGAFIGIHLRNGIDWVRACGHIESSPQLFSAPQCIGYQNEKGRATQEMCMPTNDIIVKQLKREIKKFNELNPKNEIKSIFVASDSHHMINELNTALARMQIKAYRTGDADPHIDLIILGWSNYFIGNCISSYTAFVKRERDARGFKSGFWAYPSLKIGNRKMLADEL